MFANIASSRKWEPQRTPRQDNRGSSTNVAVLVPLALTAFIVLKDALPETPKKVEKVPGR
jgi:hypothetical protein